MATGDDALAAGMSVMTGSELANTLDTEMNLTRDYIAQRTSAVTPITKGGTGATTAPAARAALGLPEIGTADLAQPNRLPVYNSASQLTTADPTAGGHAASKAYVDWREGAIRSDVQTVKEGFLTANVYNRTLGGSYHVAYVDANGTLGWVPSSRTMKQDIETAPINVQAVLALDVVTFHYKSDPDGPLQHGLIAEELHDLGLTWLVDYGTGDTPLGVRYDLLALALIPAIKSLDERVSALEAAA